MSKLRLDHKEKETCLATQSVRAKTSCGLATPALSAFHVEETSPPVALVVDETLGSGITCEVYPLLFTDPLF